MDARLRSVLALFTIAFVAITALSVAPDAAIGAPGGTTGKPVIDGDDTAKTKGWGKGGKPKGTTTTTTTLPPTTTSSTTSTTTTTTLPPTTTTTLPPSESPGWVSPEGVTINVDSAGDWTPEQVYGLLLDSALDLDVIGGSLTINVQDLKPSATAASAVFSGGVFHDFSATISLKGVSSSFASAPDAIVAHEYGHVWTEYHRFISQQGNWSAWLEYRSLSDDPRVDSTYPWSKLEMIAEDYRLLFSSPTALTQWPAPMNDEIADPRDVPGLRDFFLNVWSTSSPSTTAQTQSVPLL